MTETRNDTGLSDRSSGQERTPRLSISRWSRHGLDRLYIAGPDDEPLGYHDLRAGTDHAESALYRAIVATTADSWIRETGWDAAARAARSRGGEPLPATTAPDSGERRTDAWTDLSLNAPGTSLRAALATKTADEAASWMAGLMGEEHVGTVLAEVTRAWPVWQSIHSVPVGEGAADIDHVVMGPGGVFTLNTKHHRDASIYVNGNGFLVNGASTHHVRNARHEAQRAARLLSRAVGVPLHVTGLIVPVGARAVRVKQQPEDLFVVPADELHAWLRSTGTILPVDVLARIWEAARRSSTWRC